MDTRAQITFFSAAHAIDAEVRLYDRLFTEAEPEKDARDFKSVLNPKSLRNALRLVADDTAAVRYL